MVGYHGIPKNDRRALTCKPSSSEVQENQVIFSYTVIFRPACPTKVFVSKTTKGEEWATKQKPLKERSSLSQNLNNF